MSNVNLLERNVKRILSSAGFNSQLRADLDGYEIDVYVEYKSERIVFECKQYQRGSLTVRNLIHEWSGKQEELGVDKVVLVLVGVSVSEEDIELAAKRDIQIWQGEKVDALLDDVVDGTTNLREKILLDLDLRSDEEIESRIEEMMDSYNVKRDTAIEYLRGAMPKSKLRGLRQIRKRFRDEFVEGLELSDRDVRRYRNDGTYYGKPFTDVLEKMAELGIQDKKVARLFVGNRGGTAHGESFSKRALKKIELIVQEFDCTFERAKEFVFDVEPKMRAVRRAVNVRSERSDLKLKEVYRYLEKGFTVREIKRGDTERQAEEEEEEESPMEVDDTEKKTTEEQEKGKESSSNEEDHDTVASQEKDDDDRESPVIDLDSGELVASADGHGKSGRETDEQPSEAESKNTALSTPVLTVSGLIVLTVLLFALLA
jgi:hypothetical protein